jgi:hypothetical protein
VEVVEFTTDGWTSGPVLVAGSFLERWRGLRRIRCVGLIVPGCSVHGFGIDRPLSVVGVGRHGTVVGVRRLRPGGVVWIRGARRMIELEAGRPLPPDGAFVGLLRPAS